MSEVKEIERNPAKERNTDRVVKKHGEAITVERFEKILDLISWKLRHIGCETYRLVNHKEKMTDFTIRRYSDDDAVLELKDWGGAFGSDYAGAVYCHLQNCIIRIHTGSLFIVGGEKEKNGGLSIHFSNFDRPYSEKELFVEEQPKDFKLRQKCSRCGEFSETETSPISAFKIWLDWTTLVLSRGFSTPKCQKCGEKTFDDFNISTELIIWDLKNECEVKFEHIKQIAEPLKWDYRKLSDKPVERLIENE